MPYQAARLCVGDDLPRQPHLLRSADAVDAGWVDDFEDFEYLGHLLGGFDVRRLVPLSFASRSACVSVVALPRSTSLLE